MFQSLLAVGRKIGPRWMFRVYHWLWAWFGHLMYGFPSKKLLIIGVTGTNGKTTTAVALAHVLRRAGFRVAVSSSALFQIDEVVEPNTFMVSMPGRFILPKFLSRAVDRGCQIAIVESTSEGVLQYRHRFIHYDYFIFTNLRPEHVERHGSFEKYKEAKLELFRQLAISKKKQLLLQGIETPKSVVVNMNDEYANEFLEAAGGAKKIGVVFKEEQVSNRNKSLLGHEGQKEELVQIFHCDWKGDTLVYQDTSYELGIPGLFNAYNLALASAASTMFGISFAKALEYAGDFQGVPGRFEVVQNGNVVAIVDYAHEPFSLEIVLKLAREKFVGTLVHVFGGTSGGRDVAKRPFMGAVSERFADWIILTNDDPYDEDQMEIVNQIRAGIQDQHKVEVILDRATAIGRAITLAREKGGAVLITGKGTENLMCFERGRKIPWSDRMVVEQKLGDHCSV